MNISMQIMNLQQGLFVVSVGHVIFVNRRKCDAEVLCPQFRVRNFLSLCRLQFCLSALFRNCVCIFLCHHTF